MVIVVGFSNLENALRRFKREGQIEGIGLAVKNREIGYIKPSRAKKEKKKRAIARKNRERARRRAAS